MNNHANISDRKILTGMLLCAAFILLFIIAGPASSRADRLYPSYYSTDGSDCSKISDADYFSTEYFDPGTEITITADQPIESLYIVWEEYPGPWILTANGKDFPFNSSDYLHQYIQLPDGARGATQIAITVGDSRLTFADIYVFSAGELPAYVQKWEPSYDQADILFISTHADDEVLFFGGLIPNYINRGDVRVQLAYYSDLFQSEPYRNHEILNGLWTMGVTHYPQLGEFYDNYSESYEEAAAQFDYNESLSYIVRTIRRFKPQVVVGQDPINGEYGHGGHMWTARLIEDAVEITGNPESFADSAKTYGTWDVPKTYFHLYPEGPIEADARVPLAAFGGKTALEVAKLAYDEHQSQQWTWFAVSDGYDENGNPVYDQYSPYSCTKYGLYRSLVGEDFSGKDVLDNIVTYDAQEEKALREAREREEAQRQQEEAEKALSAANEEQPEATPAESVVNDSNITAVQGGKNTTALTILIVLAIIVAVIIVGIIVLAKIKRREEERKRIEKKRRMMAVKQRQAAAGTRSGNHVQSARKAAPARAAQGSTGRRPSEYNRSTGSSAARRPQSAEPSQQRRVSRSSNGTYNPDRSGRRS